MKHTLCLLGPYDTLSDVEIVSGVMEKISQELDEVLELLIRQIVI